MYRMNYEFLSEAPENIITDGGIYIAEDNWVCTPNVGQKSLTFGVQNTFG